LVPPRQSKLETTSADAVAVAGGNFAPTDRFYDLAVKVGGIERSIVYLEGHADAAREKLDSISTEIASAKASFNTLKWIIGAMCVGIWGPLTAFALMWAKHYFNW
jgi:hypothetical protein